MTRVLSWLEKLPTLVGDRPEPAISPIVIGATGGSGTRAFQTLLANAGVFMGARINESGDAMDFEPLLDTFINPILEEVGDLDYELTQLSSSLRAEVLAAFESALAVYRKEAPSAGPWGWKNPRTMYILPVIQHFFPKFRFLHVVRDGRYMAFSSNKNQVNKHYAALFGEAPDQNVQVAAARLWSLSNCQVARWGWGHIGSRYTLIRFEDFGRRPNPMTVRLIKVLGLPRGDIDAIAQSFQGASSLARWDEAELSLRDEILAAGQDGLKRFGYI